MSHLSEPLLVSSGQIPKSGITKSRSINTFFEILGELCQITLKRIVLLPALCDIWAPYFKRFVNDVSQFFFNCDPPVKICVETNFLYFEL